MLSLTACSHMVISAPPSPPSHPHSSLSKRRMANSDPFKTNWGMFELKVMFFGLTNSPATFQAMMNEVFKDLMDTGKVFIYMDDILIATTTMEEHRHLVNLVLECLCDN